MSGGSHFKPLSHRKCLGLENSLGSTKCDKKSRKFLPVSSGDASGLWEPKASYKREGSMVSSNQFSRGQGSALCFCGAIPDSLIVFLECPKPLK